MEFEEHEDQEEEEEEEMDPTTGGGGGGASTTNTFDTTRKPSTSTSTVRYRECLKNHAVGIGSHALDGCGEFMAAGDEGTIDALKCAACNCHRNFHRKETITHNSGGRGGGLLQQPPQPQPPYHHHGHHLSYYGRPPPPQPSSGYLHLTPPQQANRAPAPPLALPVAAASGGGNYNYNRDEVEDVSNPSSSGGGGGGGGGSSKKRFRTKFTQEQKDKMLEFAERLGWRMQRHDDDVVHQFCIETGVSRQVLKVWMHNNKHTLGKKP